MTNEDEGECLLVKRSLRVVAEADPSALVRVLMAFQNLNVVPCRVTAERATTALLHIQVDLSGLPAERLSLIAARLAQVPCIHHAYWHRS